MVLQKRLQYEFNGYEVPPTPRAPRSARKRPSSCKKTDDRNQMWAFDLLATVAGKLLLEGDNSVNAINHEEIKLINEVLKPNVYDEESCNKSFFVSEIIKNPVTDTCSGPNSGITVSDCKLEDIKIANEVPTNGKPPPVNNLGCNLNLVIRDDDENSCECTHRPTPRIGDRRIRKLSASKHDMHRNKKSYYKYQRSLRDYPFKKQKIYQLDNPCDLNNKSGSGLGETRQDSQVKLKIKSFRVPEFFIEIPKTATVSSLKRTVMEAVTAIFSGELHVGVMLQGKKIRDDNKTLLQTGICHDNKIDALGFTLEPNQLQIPSFVCTDEVSPPGTPAKVLTRYLPPQSVAKQVVIERDASPDSPVINSRNIMESDHGMSVDSRALPAVNAGPLAVVPTMKSKCAEVAQRRIRRPFSVSEVEALVEAVEKLGTGRWRDVKLRAFDDAKHRTYVDLKDKWKTLVHTARISPQQRRGEPVRQELLDRVLTTHGYWSHHQAKNQFKHQLQTGICRLL